MQPKLCVKCKKNVAVVFITRLENGVSRNEGYCLKCARKLGIPQIEEAVKQMGISEEDLDLISDEMSAAFGQNLPEEEDEVGSQTATFPLLNQLFSGSDRRRDLPEKQNKEREKEAPPKPKTKKHKFLDTYCLNLTGQAREGKLDRVLKKLQLACNPDSIEVFSDMALIATVGHGMIRRVGISAKLFSALADAGVNVRLIDQGSSELNIIVGVQNDDFEVAMRAIYASLTKEG